MVVIAILSTLVGLGLFMSIDSYRAYISRSEREVVVSVLERARSRAMANIRQTAWGVCYITPDYVIFRGNTCTPGAATNEPIPGNPNATITGLDVASPVVFTQLSGATAGATVTVTEGARVSTIVINHEGTIIW